VIASLARAGAPPRAARITAFILLAALARAILSSHSEALATLVFAMLLASLLVVEGMGGRADEARWGPWTSVAAGVAVAILLLAPIVAGGFASRALAPFVTWAVITAVVATLEEATLRGTLQQAWTREGGPLVGVVAGAVIFALIHLPSYGIGAMPIDLAVGLVLGGLRLLSGRVLPCAVAHTLADWGAWFWL
jgi:membrane protease YdiL (CAAX protease family)